MLGSYAVFANTQAAKFDSDLWKSSDQYREQMLAPLMGYVLKVGQTREEIREQLGFPIIERNIGACTDVFELCESVSQDEFEAGIQDNLVVIYSISGNVTNFYVGDRSYNFIF